MAKSNIMAVGRLNRNIRNDIECRKNYCTDIIESYGDFIGHDEQVMMYGMLMRSLEWAYGKAKKHHDEPTGGTNDNAEKEVVYV
jgi:hypothetical protein